MSKPTVLVTGCAGYIGSVLCGRLLRAGCRVIGVDSLRYQNGQALLGLLGQPGFSFHSFDVRQVEEVAKLAEFADAVVPLAALVGAPICERFPQEAQEINANAICELLKQLSPAQRVVYPNTNSGYGATDGSRPCTEEEELKPISVYGRTKCEAERAVLHHPNSAVLRLATVFGASPRMRFDLLVNDFVWQVYQIRSLKVREKLHLYEPHFMRNYVGIQDVADAFLYLLTKQWLKGVYNLGHPHANLTKRQLADRVCAALGVSSTVIVVKDGHDPDQRNYLVSNDKIVQTGFVFKHTLDRGIDEVAQVCDLLYWEEVESMRNHR